MPIEELKEKLHQLIEKTNNEVLLEDLLIEAEDRMQSKSSHVIEGLSEDDYNELAELTKDENLEKDTMTFDELKASLGRWFIK